MFSLRHLMPKREELVAGGALTKVCVSFTVNRRGGALFKPQISILTAVILRNFRIHEVRENDLVLADPSFPREPTVCIPLSEISCGRGLGDADGTACFNLEKGRGCVYWVLTDKHRITQQSCSRDIVGYFLEEEMDNVNGRSTYTEAATA